MFVIWSYEHEAWWRPHRLGYTPLLIDAGLYTTVEAARIVDDANRITVNEQAIPLVKAAAFRPLPSFCCPRCRRRSFNPTDVREKYCGACHLFNGAPT